jgi:Putative zinc-finger
MRPHLGRSTAAADHDRARMLAAARLDETLPAGDADWLEAHLAACPDCRGVAAEYDEQRSFFSPLRLDTPEPPRDLWARTAAALESESARGYRRPGWRRSRVLPLAPVAGFLAIAIVVGSGLFNGRSLFPFGPGSGGGPMPTPIDVAATDVSVVSRNEDGTVQILTRRLDQVCPMGADACGISPSFDVTTTASIAGSDNLDAIISPSGDHVVVVQRGAGATGVYVLNMAAASPTPTPSVVAPAATPGPTGTPGDSAQLATPEPLATVTPEPSSPATAGPLTSDAPATPATAPSATPGTAPSATPATAPSATPVASPEPTAPAPTPDSTPTVAVSPTPGGPLKIASGVIVVGSIESYAPDGSMFAFTARSADGSTGPDVFVWTVGDAAARAVTADHASVFSGWMDGRLLVSRVAGGTPLTVLVNPATGAETAVGGGQTWRPAVGPGQRTAVWWDGTVKLADDGVTPVPGAGRLVLAAWPAGSDAGTPQVLHAGSLVDWDVRWDEGGTVLAVWTTKKDAGAAGSLSLYAIDAATGRADLDHPLLDAEPAFAGFSLEAGRLVWSAPAEGGDATVQVFAWSGDSTGHVQLPTEQGTTIVH